MSNTLFLMQYTPRGDDLFEENAVQIDQADIPMHLLELIKEKCGAQCIETYDIYEEEDEPSPQDFLSNMQIDKIMRVIEDEFVTMLGKGSEEDVYTLGNIHNQISTFYTITNIHRLLKIKKNQFSSDENTLLQLG